MNPRAVDAPATATTPTQASSRQHPLDDLRARLDVSLEPLVDPVPWALVTQAQRRSELKATLLRQGAFTVASLAEGWQVPVATARKRVNRWDAQRRIFTATNLGERLVPALCLTTADLEPRTELRAAIEALRAAGDDGWALWAWWSLPSPWLDGAVPEVLARTDPARVADAARRRAAA